MLPSILITLAEIAAPTEPSISTTALGIWVGCAFLALGAMVNGLLLFKMLRNDPEKREVSITGIPATKAELDGHIAQNLRDHEGLHSKLGGVERGARASTDDKFTQLQNKIMQLHGDLSAVRAQNDAQTARIHQMEQAISDMPAQIVALLKNTNAI